VCAIHDVGEHEEWPFLVVAHVDGETLRQKLDSGPLAADEAVDLATQIAQGLEAAHRQGVVHQDIRPGTVMVTPEGQAKLMDFGLHELEGDPAMADEEPDPRIDLKAFGDLLHEMLSEEAPAELEQVYLRARGVDAENRYALISEALAELVAYRDRSRVSVSGEMVFKEMRRRLRRPSVWVPIAAGVAVVAVLAGWWVYQSGRVRWAHDEAIPEIARLVQEGRYHRAFLLTREVERVVPGEPGLEDLWAQSSTRISLETTPAGATVRVRDYEYDDTDWIFLGTTPLRDVRAPFGFGQFQIEKKGFQTVDAALESSLISRIGFPGQGERKSPVILRTHGELPVGMVPVQGFKSKRIEIPPFLIDRYEVTNRQFKRFVDAGGYRTRDYWKHPLALDGQELSWDEAISRFVGVLDRPGPSGWRLGEYPEGEGDHPVRGVSWYEAAAYAEWAGKSLPTVHHWTQAAYGTVGFNLAAPFMVKRSNIGGGETGPVAVGSFPGISVAGAADLVGNVAEWCWNPSGSRRCMMGGSWKDPWYVAVYTQTRDPFERDETIGFRCALFDEGLDKLDALKEPVQAERPEYPDFDRFSPVPDEVFEVYRRQFDYDRVEPEPVVEERDESHGFYVRERIGFNHPVSNAAMMAYVYLPIEQSPPYQTVVMFPGSSVRAARTIEDSTFEYRAEVLLRSGRAVVLPVFEGTLDRGGGPGVRSPRLPASRRDRVVLWTREFRATLDYLETREDLDTDRLAFWGLSWGAKLSPFVLATDSRPKVAILVGTGLYEDPEQSPHPEVDGFHYLPRVKVPVLMVAGSMDALYTIEESQRPFFDRLGTPDADKRFVVAEAGHAPLNRFFHREQLDWLDKYLGPVD
jgi:tRNA A-37 threonylcarbamoyl transferase component Bud32/dienelactone hydrolase